MYGNARPRGSAAVALLAGLLAGSGALAQTAGNAASGTVSSSDLPAMAAPSEAAQRQALSPFRMILNANNFNKAKPATAAAPAVTPAPVAVAAPAKRAVAAAPAPAPAHDSPAVAAPAMAAKASPPAPTPTAPLLVAAAAPVPMPAPTPAPAAPAPALQLAAASPAPAAVPALPLATPQAPARTELIPIRQDPPVLSNTVMAEVPNGLVKVRFDVNPDGSTGGVHVASSSNRKLNGPAISAVSKWKFQPIDTARSVEIEMSFANE